MAEGSESAYPRHKFVKPEPLPDEMVGSPKYGVGPNGEPVIIGRNILRPNDPAPPSEPVEDRRPGKLLLANGFSSAEEWGNEILAKRNGHGGR